MVTKCKPCHFSCPVADSRAVCGDQEAVRSDKKARHARGAVSALSTRAPKVTGLKPAIESLRNVLNEVFVAQRDIYTALGTAGMLCCRFQRDSTTVISNHSWGTAIDLKVNNRLDVRGDGKVQYGLAVIAPIFNKHGWYWGAAFRTEDAMHFEASKSLIDAWAISLGT